MNFIPALCEYYSFNFSVGAFDPEAMHNVTKLIGLLPSLRKISKAVSEIHTLNKFVSLEIDGFGDGGEGM